MVTIVVVVSRVSHGHKGRDAAGSSVVWVAGRRLMVAG